MLPLSTQLLWLFILAIPVACIAWTVTHEDVLREPREYCTFGLLIFFARVDVSITCLWPRT